MEFVKTLNIQHPSGSDYFIRCYLEDDGTWDVDVYESDERDSKYSKGYITDRDSAIAYAYSIAEILVRLGTVAINLPRKPVTSIVNSEGWHCKYCGCLLCEDELENRMCFVCKENQKVKTIWLSKNLSME